MRNAFREFRALIKTQPGLPTTSETLTKFKQECHCFEMLNRGRQQLLNDLAHANPSGFSSIDGFFDFIVTFKSLLNAALKLTADDIDSLNSTGYADILALDWGQDLLGWYWLAERKWAQNSQDSWTREGFRIIGPLARRTEEGQARGTLEIKHKNLQAVFEFAHPFKSSSTLLSLRENFEPLNCALGRAIREACENKRFSDEAALELARKSLSEKLCRFKKQLNEQELQILEREILK